MKEIDWIFDEEEFVDDVIVIGDIVHVYNYSVKNQYGMPIDGYYGYGEVTKFFENRVFIKNRKKDGKKLRNRFFNLDRFNLKIK